VVVTKLIQSTSQMGNFVGGKREGRRSLQTSFKQSLGEEKRRDARGPRESRDQGSGAARVKCKSDLAENKNEAIIFLTTWQRGQRDEAVASRLWKKRKRARRREMDKPL